MHGLQHAALARHVVRARRDRSERRTPQHELDGAEAQQIRQIRMTAGELLDPHRRRVRDHRQMRAQILLDRRPVELLARAHRLGVGHL